MYKLNMIKGLLYMQGEIMRLRGSVFVFNFVLPL